MKSHLAETHGANKNLKNKITLWFMARLTQSLKKYTLVYKLGMFGVPHAIPTEVIPMTWY